MFYFLLFVAYGFLFFMNYHSISIFVMAALGTDPSAPVTDHPKGATGNAVFGLQLLQTFTII